MRISLLGELEVLDDDGRAVVVTGAKQRALLAVLALHAGQMVPADQLVEALVGRGPAAGGSQRPAGARVEAASSARLAGPAGRCAAAGTPRRRAGRGRRAPLRAAGRAGRAAAADGDLAARRRAARRRRRAVAGSALAEFAYEEFASARDHSDRPSCAWPRSRNGSTLELQLGRIRGVVGELETLVAAHPLRERLRGLLMLALYRARRQAEALRVVRDGRRILSEELGLDPDPELQRLEAAILAQDPSLAAPGGAGPTTPAAPRDAAHRPGAADPADRPRRRGARARRARRRTPPRHPRRPGRGRQDAARAGGRAASPVRG